MHVCKSVDEQTNTRVLSISIEQQYREEAILARKIWVVF